MLKMLILFEKIFCIIILMGVGKLDPTKCGNVKIDAEIEDTMILH